MAALALDPHDAICDATYGMFLATAYRFDEARARLARALERDPFSAQVHFLVAVGGLRDVRRRAEPRVTPPAPWSCSPTRSARAGRRPWRCS